MLRGLASLGTNMGWECTLLVECLPYITRSLVKTSVHLKKNQNIHSPSSKHFVSVSGLGIVLKQTPHCERTRGWLCSCAELCYSVSRLLPSHYYTFASGSFCSRNYTVKKRELDAWGWVPFLKTYQHETVLLTASWAAESIKHMHWCLKEAVTL